MRTEFYGIGTYPLESCEVAFPWVFTINNNGRLGNQNGPIEVQLACSGDLSDWVRQFRNPCIPLGAVGERDSGMIYTQSRALRVDDEIWLYYGGANFTHGAPLPLSSRRNGLTYEIHEQHRSGKMEAQSVCLNGWSCRRRYIDSSSSGLFGGFPGSQWAGKGGWRSFG